MRGAPAFPSWCQGVPSQQPQHAGALQLPATSLTHRYRQRLSDHFLIHFPSKQMTGCGPETELPKGRSQEDTRAQAGQSFLASPRSCSSCHLGKRYQRPARGQAGWPSCPHPSRACCGPETAARPSQRCRPHPSLSLNHDGPRPACPTSSLHSGEAY